MMNDKASIRRAVSEDMETLIDLCRDYCGADGHRFDPAGARRAFGPLLSSDTRGFVVVVEVDGFVAGYAVATWGWSIESGGLDALLDEIYVRDRKRGMGSRLVAAVVERSRHAGASRIFLETERHNSDARRLYERHGFTVEDSVWMSLELEVSGP